MSLMKILSVAEWQHVTSIVKSQLWLPAWMQVYLSYTQENFNSNNNVNISEINISSSYIDFLNSQIKLEARGVSWSEVLQTRLNALKRHVGKKMLRICFRHEDEMLILYFSDDSGLELLHHELN